MQCLEHIVAKFPQTSARTTRVSMKEHRPRQLLRVDSHDITDEKGQCVYTGQALVLPNADDVEKVALSMVRHHELVQARAKMEACDATDEQQLYQPIFEEIDGRISTHFGLKESVDADSCRMWLLELMKALDENKVTALRMSLARITLSALPAPRLSCDTAKASVNGPTATNTKAISVSMSCGAGAGSSGRQQLTCTRDSSRAPSGSAKAFFGSGMALCTAVIGTTRSHTAWVCTCQQTARFPPQSLLNHLN